MDLSAVGWERGRNNLRCPGATKPSSGTSGGSTSEGFIPYHNRREPITMLHISSSERSASYGHGEAMSLVGVSTMDVV